MNAMLMQHLTTATAKGPNAVKSPKVFYVCDFLNIFSDFREIKYKKNNVDFHSVKHNNKEQDTIDFFDLFFTKYISYVGIGKDSAFIFVMKKLNAYEHILHVIIQKYKSFDVKLLIIEDKLEETTLDKNKDDFLCQYIFNSIQCSQGNCVLISNDKYRDRQTYVNMFERLSDMSIQVVKWSCKDKCIQTSSIKFVVNPVVSDKIMNQTYKRCTIPKHKLTKIL